jgi:hypothetical protein
MACLCESFGVEFGEFAGLGFGVLLVALPLGGGLVIEGVVGVGLGEETLDGEQDRLHLEGGGPVLLEDVEADPS